MVLRRVIGPPFVLSCSAHMPKHRLRPLFHLVSRLRTSIKMFISSPSPPYPLSSRHFYHTSLRLAYSLVVSRRTMAQTQASVLRDWDIDELLYLQTTSNIIGIPLSHLLRFAGTCHDGVRFQAPNVATTTSSREWTGGELVALQEAARILSIYLPSLLSFAETSSQQASSGDLPIAQNVSFSRFVPSASDPDFILQG